MSDKVSISGGLLKWNKANEFGAFRIVDIQYMYWESNLLYVRTIVNNFKFEIDQTSAVTLIQSWASSDSHYKSIPTRN